MPITSLVNNAEWILLFFFFSLLFSFSFLFLFFSLFFLFILYFLIIGKRKERRTIATLYSRVCTREYPSHSRDRNVLLRINFFCENVPMKNLQYFCAFLGISLSLRGSLHFTLFYFILFHFTSLHFISLHFTSFHFASFHFTSFHFTHFILLYFILLYFISLHFISFHFISFHFVSFHFTLFQISSRSYPSLFLLFELTLCLENKKKEKKERRMSM
jgi:hypothetical protein